MKYGVFNKNHDRVLRFVQIRFANEQIGNIILIIALGIRSQYFGLLSYWRINMKQSIKKTALALAVASVLGLSACNDDKQTTTPITKSTSGVITGFGSVFINGVEYETDDAMFVVDGVEGGEELLKLGMVVSLDGSTNGDGTGNALSIEFDDDVEGVVISTDIATDGTGTLNIMGVTVHIDEDTVFESKDATITMLSDVIAGNIIEVSGHSSGDGSVWATRVEVKSAVKEEGEDMEVKGTISSLDELEQTFTLGSITVDYSTAELEDDFLIADDLFVEVKSEEVLDANGVLLASKIELEDGGKKSLDHDDDDDEVELEGVITRLISDAEIEVNGHAVLLSATTKYVHGTAIIATVGMKIKVKGDVDADGNLVAEKVIFKPSGDLKLAGRISATDVVSNTVTVFGVGITLSNSTLVKDDRDEDDLGTDSENIKYKFGVDDLVVGDWIKVKAYLNSDGGLTATKMVRKTEDVDKEGKLEGKLDLAVGTSDYYIAGIKVDLSGLNDITLAVGDKVELEGTFENGVFTALEAEAKEEDAYYVGGKDADEDDSDDDDQSEEDDDSEDDDGEDEDDDDSEHQS